VSLLVIGLSHRTAPVAVLERAAVAAQDGGKLLEELMRSANVAEAFLLSTCNRVEVCAVVETFHGGMADITGVLANHVGSSDVSGLADHLYVHYAGAAVKHVFSVAAGLDSMVVGESQILAQLRTAYSNAAEAGAAGRTLHELAQQALRVGKRVHAETGIDAAGRSVVAEALADAAAVLGGSGVAGRRVVLVGAGSMGALVAAHLRRAGIAQLTVVNRSLAGAQRLADAALADGVAAAAVELAELPAVLADTELLITCTGAVGTLVDVPTVRHARAPLVICDLGLPHDVEPEVGALPGVTLIDLAGLQRRLAAPEAGAAGAALAQAREIVSSEVAEFLAAQRSAEVTPTVTALRRRAAEVVAAELLRLESQLPDLDEAVRAEVAKTVHRVVEKLLHTPTMRIKQLAAGAAAHAYADALRELFDLDPTAPAALSSAESSPDGERL
jgi:glutamyl-tRNA reductase